MTRQGSTIDIDGDSHRNKKAKRKHNSESAVDAHPPLAAGAQQLINNHALVLGAPQQAVPAAQHTPANSPAAMQIDDIPPLELDPQANNPA